MVCLEQQVIDMKGCLFRKNISNPVICLFYKTFSIQLILVMPRFFCYQFFFDWNPIQGAGNDHHALIMEKITVSYDHISSSPVTLY